MIWLVAAAVGLGIAVWALSRKSSAKATTTTNGKVIETVEILGTQAQMTVGGIVIPTAVEKVEGISYASAVEAQKAIIAKEQANITKTEEDYCTFQSQKNRAGALLALEQNILFYQALSKLGYPIPDYKLNTRCSLDRELDEIRAGKATFEEVMARHGY